LVALALTGGLAILAATKAYGISFLGEPRSEAARMATDPPALEILPLLLGAVGCVALGVWPASAISLLSPALRVLGIGNEGLPVFERALFSVGTVALLIIGAASLLWLTSLLLVWRCGKRYEPTWGCGYEHPSPRMQYTAMSYSQPLSVPFDGLLAERVAQEPVSGVFPAPASYEAWPNDVTGERLLLPLLARLRSLVGRLRLVQHGHLQTYLFYVFLTLVAALLWQLATTHP
jgi:hydrogenase-4 component B